MGSPSMNLVSGVVLGTGAAISVTRPGARPKLVIAWCNDLGDGTAGVALWWEGMPDATALTSLGTTGAWTYTASAAITPADTGFTIGTSGVINQDTKDTYWLAFI